MRKILATMLMALVIFAGGCKNVDNTAIIKVNDEVITKQEVEDIVSKQLESPFLAQLDKSSNEYKLLVLVAKDKAINEMIVKKILTQEVSKRNITVSQEEIDEYEKNLLAQVGGEDNLKEILKKNNMSKNDFYSMIENDIQISKLINSIAIVKITDSDVKNFYNNNKASKFTHPDTVRASHILIKDKAKAQEVLAQAKAEKADFGELAKQYSEDKGSAQNGGDLGFFTKDQMVKPFSNAAFSMKPDTVSDLVQSEFGYHIIKVVDRKKAGVTPFEDVKAEIKKYLEDEKKVDVLQKFIDGQKSQVTVEYIDANYNPENIKKEVQQYASKEENVAPMQMDMPSK